MGFGCSLVAPRPQSASREFVMTTQALGCHDNRATLHASRHVAKAADAVPAPPRKARVLRYALLTVFGAPANFLLYAGLLRYTAMGAALATVVAALFVIVPKFFLSKLWVWRASTNEHLRREIVVYLLVTFGSLAFATAVGAILDANGARDSMLVAGNLASFTLMWVLRFVILDRYGFISVRSPAKDPPSDPESFVV